MYNYNTPSPNQDVSSIESERQKDYKKNSKTSLGIQPFNFFNLPCGKNNVGYS